jgi:hypothetical protein
MSILAGDYRLPIDSAHTAGPAIRAAVPVAHSFRAKKLNMADMATSAGTRFNQIGLRSSIGKKPAGDASGLKFGHQ